MKPTEGKELRLSGKKPGHLGIAGVALKRRVQILNSGTWECALI